MIYAAVGALLVGLSLGIFGSGGSILTVPVLVYLLGHGEKVAIAESLGIVGCIALIGAVPYARDRLVDWRTAALFGIPGMAGTFAGAWVAGFVAGPVQLLVFGGVMAVAATSMWRKSARSSPGAQEPTPRRAPAALAAMQGVGVGAMTGFVGVGGGFLIVPALVLIAGLPMRRAVATSLVVITLNCAVGLIKHQQALTDAGATPDWPVMAVFVVVGGIGSIAGRRIQARVNQRLLRRGFAMFLFAMAAMILVQESISMTQGAPDDAGVTRTEPN